MELVVDILGPVFGSSGEVGQAQVMGDVRGNEKKKEKEGFVTKAGKAVGKINEGIDDLIKKIAVTPDMTKPVKKRKKKNKNKDKDNEKQRIEKTLEQTREILLTLQQQQRI